ncbi:hypothetical protein [Streptomyces sp. cg35]|uniref:hypothetical protein n=1 Tax=Streptomyces sp. cg35 TaxID=3421650 RepID=UPI003D172BC9
MRGCWPRDVVGALRAQRRAVHELGQIFVEGVLAGHAYGAVRQLGDCFAEIRRLPGPRRCSASCAEPGCLTVAEAFLAAAAERLLHEVHAAQQLLDDAPEHFLGVDEVVRDFADDLEQACGRAMTLLWATAEVEWAGHGLVGVDLREGDLQGVRFEGIRWDAATSWPQLWETLIRRASRPATDEGGVLIVSAEPHDSVVAADV